MIIALDKGFLAAAGKTTVAATAFRSGLARAAEELDPRVAAIVAATIGIDTHNHIDVPITAAEQPGPDLDLVGEIKRSGLSAICATFASLATRTSASIERWRPWIGSWTGARYDAP